MYSLKEIMQMLDVPERTIRRHINQGILKGEKTKGAWSFSEQDVEQYFKSDVGKHTMRRSLTSHVFEYINGSSNGEELLLVKHLPHLQKNGAKQLSLFVSEFEQPFYFNIDQRSNKSIMVFKGSESDAYALLEKVKSIV